LKKRATEITFLKRRVAVVQSQEMVLVGKGERGKVMADLYEFPYFEEGEEFMGAIFQKFGLQVRLVRRLREITHTFTKFKALLYPYLLKTDTPLPIPGWDWMTKKDLYRLPFSAGHRKILKEILQ
ncbi:MAG TPA: NUDIX domain-containing protein, partial [Chlamydiales bacterium]|nr:NUDIX domain-containing protein [Chlamydiales bacterium]